MSKTLSEFPVMSIDTSCQNCGTRLTVSGDLDGQEVRCPQCDHVFRCVTIQPVTQRSEKVPLAEGAALEELANESQDHRTEATPIEPENSPATAAGWLLRTPESSQFGPVDQETLDNWVADGRVSDDCELRQENSDVWEPAGNRYPILIDEGNPFAPHFIAHDNQNQDPHRGRMILGLALASCLIPFVSFWASIMGTRDLRRMQLGRMESSGESLTRAGQVIATVASMMWIVAFAAGLLVLLFRIMRSF